MHKYFPYFDYDLPKLDGFVDLSNRNDTCPSLWNDEFQLMLFCDFKDVEKRETSGDGKLFTLFHEVNCDLGEPLFESDNIQDIKEFLKVYKSDPINNNKKAINVALELLKSLGINDPHIGTDGEHEFFAFTHDDISIYDTSLTSCGRGDSSYADYGLTDQQNKALIYMNDLFNFKHDQ